MSRSGLLSRTAAIASLLLAGLALLDGRPALASKIKMAFPGPATTFSLPLYVAQKKGWLGDLEVEEVVVTGDSNAMRVLLSGNADIALVGTFNVLASIHAGAKVRAVNSWQPIGDYSLVLATGKGSKLADLAGKTFASSGPGALPDQLPRLIMRKYDVDATTTRFVQVGGHAARLQAVVGGRADATLINTITALKGVQEGKVTVLTRISQEFPGLGYVWNMVRADSVDNPQLAAAYQVLTEAGIRASRFIMENPDEAAEIMHARVPDLDLAFLKAVIRDLNAEKLWGVDGGIDPKIEEFTADLNMKLGNLPVAAPAKRRARATLRRSGDEEARPLSAEMTEMATTAPVPAETPDAMVVYEDVSKFFPVRVRPGQKDRPDLMVALDRVNATIRKGEFITLLGPSGCGKTTLLRLTAGLLTADEGRITIEGTPVSRPRKDACTVFQNFGLLPWRTVMGNVEFPLEIDGVPQPNAARPPRTSSTSSD